MNQADILVINPQTEFLIKAKSTAGTVLAKVKWAGVGGPEGQLINTWTIGAVQQTDGKTSVAFASDSDVDSVKQELDTFIGDCEVQINNFMQGKSTKSGDKKSFTVIDEFADDKAYEAGFGNQDLEDQVDTLLAESIGKPEKWAYLSCGKQNLNILKISQNIIKILEKVTKLPDNIDELNIDDASKQKIKSVVDDVTMALTNQELTSPDQWRDLVYKAIVAGFGDPEFDEMDDASIHDFVNQNILVESKSFNSFESLLEAIKLGSDKAEAINDRTGKDYGPAFDILHKNVDRVKQVANGIYRHNNVASEDQITTHLIDNIETFLNKYMAEFADIEAAHQSGHISVISNNIVSVLNGWIKQIHHLETVVNQHHNTGNVTGRYIIGHFNTEVYPEMADIDRTISKMKFGMNSKNNSAATGLATDMVAIIKHLDATMNKFYADRMTEINKVKTWKQPANAKPQPARV